MKNLLAFGSILVSAVLVQHLVGSQDTLGAWIAQEGGDPVVSRILIHAATGGIAYLAARSKGYDCNLWGAIGLVLGPLITAPALILTQAALVVYRLVGDLRGGADK